MKKRVELARKRQRERFFSVHQNGSRKAPFCNAQMRPRDIGRYCQMTKAARSLLQSAFQTLALSARSHDKLLKVSRTIADLDGADIINDGHLAEAFQYRSMDKILANY
ncbi:MAG: hypothetical protein RQM92_09955 [Candidatus Syntrophopropionicum ammoniitolerans]